MANDAQRVFEAAGGMRRPIGALRLRPHQAKKLKQLSWPVCKFCGLVYLKNELTRQAIRVGCWLWEDER